MRSRAVTFVRAHSAEAILRSCLDPFNRHDGRPQWAYRNFAHRCEPPLDSGLLDTPLLRMNHRVALLRRDALLIGPNDSPTWNGGEFTDAEAHLVKKGVHHACAAWSKYLNPARSLAAEVRTSGRGVIRFEKPSNYPGTWCVCCFEVCRVADSLEGRLHMTVNDPIRVLPYNVYEFTALLSRVSSLVGLPVGAYAHIADHVEIRGEDDRCAALRLANMWTSCS